MEDATTLTKGKLILSASPGGDYIPVPLEEPLKAHISEVKLGTGRNFDTGDPEPTLVVNFTLDEDIEGKGQVYTKWVKPSMNEKSNLFKLTKAVFGKIPETEADGQKGYDPFSLVGQPLRITLKNSAPKPDGTIRTIVDTYIKAAADQKPVDVKPADKVLSAEEFDQAANGDLNLDEIPF